MKEHEGMTTPSGLETPASYNGSRKPTSAELAAPTKIYPASSKIGHGGTDKGSTIEGPCTGKKGYEK